MAYANRDGEAAVVGQGDRRRLSIWEQTMFPFQPTIDALKARRAKAQASGEASASRQRDPDEGPARPAVEAGDGTVTA